MFYLPFNRSFWSVFSSWFFLCVSANISAVKFIFWWICHQAWVRPSGSAHYQQTQVQKGSKTQRFIKCSVVRMRCNHAIRALEWPRYKDFAFSKNHYSRRLHQNPNRVFSRGWCCCATLPRKTRYFSCFFTVYCWWTLIFRKINRWIFCCRID